MWKSVHQEVRLPAAPNEVYRAYLTSREHSKFTGAPARISSRVGGRFTCWDGDIRGVNVDLVPGRRIVQAWRLSHWKDGVYSIVSFELRKKGKGTLLVLDHVGIPDSETEDLAEGWTTFYWTPMRGYFG